MVDYNTSTTLILFRPFTTVKVVFMKLSIIDTSRCFSRKCPYKHSKQCYPDQTDRIGSVGYVSTLIESILSTEWQCLKIKLADTKQSRF